MRRGRSAPRPYRVPRDESVVRVPHWAMAAFVMMGLHVLWLIWLAPAANRYHAPRTFAPRLTFLTHPADHPDGQDANGDARVLWSPILLSLPTPMGFSGAVRSDDPEVRPALEAPTGHAMYLERPDYESRWPENESKMFARPPPTAPSRFTPYRPPVSQAAEPASEPGLTLRFENGLSPDQFVETPWRDEPVREQAGSDWELTARLIFDADEGRRTVLIERPAHDPVVNQHAARQLRQWKMRPDLERIEGRVTLSHTGVQAPPVAEHAGETGL